MKLTKSKLKQIIKEELSKNSASAENIEEAFPGAHAGPDDARTEWLVERVGELFRRITELEKEIGVEWKGEGK